VKNAFVLSTIIVLSIIFAIAAYHTVIEYQKISLSENSEDDKTNSTKRVSIDQNCKLIPVRGIETFLNGSIEEKTFYMSIGNCSV